MPITVEPSTFTMVDYEAAEIVALTEELARKVGLGEDVEIRIEVDETSPLGRTQLLSVDPVHIRTESGSLEDLKKVRKFSVNSATDVLGRYLLRAADRRLGDFGDAPDDGELTVPQKTAWDVYAVGRLSRLGYSVQRQRWLYSFRNRHGFTDDADGAFEQLWDGTDLAWADLDRLSQSTVASNPGPLSR